MSSEDKHRDLIRELLDPLEGEEREELDRVSNLSPEALADLERLDAEVLGLLAYQLEPVEPSSDLRDRILAGTGEEQLAEVVPLVREPSIRTSRWALPLAASTFLSLALSGWLLVQMGQQKGEIVSLADELTSAKGSSTELVGLKTQYVATRDQLALVTEPGVEICALKPRSVRNAAGGPRGVLYVAETDDRWYLKLYDLEPSPAGMTYQLWFHVPAGPVSGGTFSVGEGGVVELSSDAIAAKPTRGVSVSLEPEGGAELPSSEVLFGDEVMRVL